MLMGLFPSVNRTDCKPRAPSISAWRHRGEEGGEEGTHMTPAPLDPDTMEQLLVSGLPGIQGPRWLRLG